MLKVVKYVFEQVVKRMRDSDSQFYWFVYSVLTSGGTSQMCC